MTDTLQTPPTARQAEPQSPKPAKTAGAKIHRVCIGCNNMFEVALENYEVKHCPVCRKE